MYKQIFTEENYDFKKAMQTYVRDKWLLLVKRKIFYNYI